MIISCPATNARKGEHHVTSAKGQKQRLSYTLKMIDLVCVSEQLPILAGAVYVALL
jgi:hypothetical protein